MSHVIIIGANVVAVLILVFGLYFPRHRHRDMVVAFLGINIGVLSVATVLSSVTTSLSVGFGLFGVLSIIRLRSDELNQRQVAYYFVSLALGLLGGTPVDDIRISIGLMAIMVLVLWIGDHPRLYGRYRSRMVTVDRAFLDDRLLLAYLRPQIAGEIRAVTVIRTDLVNDTTVIDVRYTLDERDTAPEPETAARMEVALKW